MNPYNRSPEQSTGGQPPLDTPVALSVRYAIRAFAIAALVIAAFAAATPACEAANLVNQAPEIVPFSAPEAGSTEARTEMGIVIQPANLAPRRESAPVVDPPPAPGNAEMDPADQTDDPVDPAEYRAVYDSIPFSRAEYDANPNFRHDTTMEILTGKLRTHVTKTTECCQKPRPRRPRRNFYVYGRYQKFQGRWGYFYQRPFNAYRLVYPGYGLIP
jgi:hypothetical protein